MSKIDRIIAVFAILLMVGALWLLAGIGWRAALGVFMFAWGNNLVYSWRLKRTIKSKVWA